MAKSKHVSQLCPCGSGADFQQCCERYIAGTEPAPDARKLMQSRYTAYTLENEMYLQKTWHPRSRPAQILNQAQSCKWTGLKVIAHHQQVATATVEFIARYKISGRAHQIHEVSKFEREDGQWFYVDGDFPEEKQEFKI